MAAKARGKKASAARRGAQAPEESGISAIGIEGFKSIAKRIEIAIRPLTILAGANSSGKSSMMQPALLMKQTLEAPYDPGALLLDGPHVRFTAVEQLLSRVDARSSNRFSVSIWSTSRFSDICGFEKKQLKIIFQKRSQGGLDVVKMVETPDMPRSSGVHATWIRDRCFLREYVPDLSSEEPGKRLFLPRPAVSRTQHYLRAIIHVPALRGNPERTYKTTAVGEEFPGTFEPYVASIIHHWQTTKDIRLKQLGIALGKLGLNWKIQASRIDDTRVELRVGRLRHRTREGARDLVNIADVGFGVSQVLPVLVALLTARPGQLLYIEEPEIHLHPRAQVALGQVLADAANRGVRVVIETHSSLLLLGVQALVAEGALRPELVALHWFSLAPDGTTDVRSADLDESGAFGDWPEDFAEVALDAQARYLDAAEKRLAKVKR